MSTKPQGKDAVQAALIQAAASLFAQRGLASVSLREIAQEANVNHGLIHRHFGSKKGLIMATINRLSKDIATEMGSTSSLDSLQPILAKAFVKTASRQEYWKILAHLMLTEGGDELLQPDFPLVSRMLEVTKKEDSKSLTSEAHITLLLSMGLGMMVFRPYLQRAIGVDNDQWGLIQKEILQWGSQQ
jgi:AcrR family transcriptional regulator